MRRSALLLACGALGCASFEPEVPSGAAVDRSAIGFDRLTQLARENGSIEATLRRLPPEWSMTVTFLTASRSVQRASAESPRLLVADPEARLVVAATGSPTAEGGDALEVMERDPRSGTFVFRELKFGNGGVRASPANDPRCLGCHGSPPLPLWPSAPAVASADASALARWSTLPRVAALRAALRADGAAFAAEAAYEGRSERSVGAVLAEAALGSVVGELAARPSFAAARWALLGAARGRCGAIDDWMPAALANAFGRGDREGDDAPLGALPRFAEQVMGVDPSRWTTALGEGAGRFPPLRAPRASFERALLARFGPVSERAYASAADCQTLRSESLRALREARLAPAPSVGSRAVDGAELLAACSGCHANGVGPTLRFGDARALAERGYPHGSLLDEVAARLRSPANIERMPPTRALTATEQAALLRELERRAAGPHEAMATRGD
jgi:hypothetical protein